MIPSEVLEKETMPAAGNINDTPSFFDSHNVKDEIIKSSNFKKSLIKNQKNWIIENYKNNHNTRAILQYGDWYALQDNVRKALSLYMEAWMNDSESIIVYKKIIDLLIKHNRFDDAETYFNQFLSSSDRIEVKKEYIKFKVFKASHLNDLSDANIIMKFVNDYLQTNAQDIEIINLRGFLLLAKNEITTAINEFKKCLEIDSNYIHAINNLGVCYLKSKEYAEAELLFKKAIELNQYSYPFSYQNLASLYLQQNKEKEALEVLENAVFRDVSLDYENKHTYGWLLLGSGEINKARLWYEKLLEKEKNNDLLYNNLGVCYFKLGSAITAEKIFRQAVDVYMTQLNKGIIKDKRSLNSLYNLARITSDIPTIERMADTILSLDENDPYGHYFKGAYFLKLGKCEESISCFEEALRINKKIKELYPDYSFLLSSIKKDYNKSIALLNEALELGLKTDLIINNLADAYINSGNLEKAEKLICENESITLGVFKATRGALEIRKNNLDKGIGYFNESRALLTGKRKNDAFQLMNLEIAYYWFRNNNYELAMEYIGKAKSVGPFYVSDIYDYILSDINDLEEEIKSKQ